MAICSYLVLSFIFIFSVVSEVAVLQAEESYYILQGYTLASGIIFPLMCMIIFLNYSQPNPTHCKFNSFEKQFLGLLLIWNIFSVLTFFLCVHNLNQSISYRTYSIFYLCIFNIPLLIIISSFIIGLLTSESFYKDALSNYQYYFLGYRGLVYFIGIEEYKLYPLFSWARVNALGAGLLNVVVGRLFRSIFKDRPIGTKFWILILLLIFQFLEGLSAPLLPFSFILNFLFIFLKENLFATNYIFAVLSLVNVLFLGLGGLILPMFHLLFDINRYLKFQPSTLKVQGRIIDTIYFCQQCAQLVVLGGFYYYTEENLPTFANVGIGTIFFFCVVCLCHHVYTMRRVSSTFPVQFEDFKALIGLQVGLRGIILLIGLILSCVFFVMAYKDDNFLDEFPYFSRFLVISGFHFVYSGILAVFFYGFIINKAQQNMRILEERAQQEGAQNEEDSELQEAIKPIAERSEVEVVDEECAVCLSELFKEDGTGEVSQIKKCGHLFHTTCINQWFTIDKTCPTDRKPI